MAGVNIARKILTDEVMGITYALVESFITLISKRFNYNMILSLPLWYYHPTYELSTSTTVLVSSRLTVLDRQSRCTVGVERQYLSNECLLNTDNSRLWHIYTIFLLGGFPTDIPTINCRLNHW